MKNENTRSCSTSIYIVKLVQIFYFVLVWTECQGVCFCVCATVRTQHVSFKNLYLIIFSLIVKPFRKRLFLYLLVRKIKLFRIVNSSFVVHSKVFSTNLYCLDFKYQKYETKVLNNDKIKNISKFSITIHHEGTGGVVSYIYHSRKQLGFSVMYEGPSVTVSMNTKGPVYLYSFHLYLIVYTI